MRLRESVIKRALFSTTAALFATAVVTTSAIAPSTASAEPSDPNASPPSTVVPPEPSARIIHNQQLIDEATEPMWALVKGEGDDSYGYARATVDQEALTATIQWKRPIPEALQALSGVTPSGVRINIVSVPYSQHDLNVIASKVRQSAKLSGITHLPSVMANEDFDGFDVGYSVEDLKNLDIGSVAKNLTDLTGAKISVGKRPYDFQGASGRQDDSKPWYGGGAMIGQAFCSTGFSVRTSSGSGRLLSAAHCD